MDTIPDVPIRAGEVKKGMIVYLKDKPCKVSRAVFLSLREVVFRGITDQAQHHANPRHAVARAGPSTFILASPPPFSFLNSRQQFGELWITGSRDFRLQDWQARPR